MTKALAGLCISLAFLAVGCHGGGGSAGSSSTARLEVRLTQREWLGEVTRRGRRSRAHRRTVRFPSPSATVFAKRLQAASARYGFTVERLRVYRPLQLAPFVVVRTDHPRRLSRDMRAIEMMLDPKSPAARDDRLGWAYEGFYFEAKDEAGTPTFAVFNFMRGSGAGGGQWARSESFYPYDHG